RRRGLGARGRGLDDGCARHERARFDVRGAAHRRPRPHGGDGMTPAGLEISGGETVLFWVVAPLMVLAALGLLFVRRAVHAAMCLVFVMISMAILYIAQEAPFLGVVQVVVYTG